MNLINEQYTGDDLSATFLTPFSNLLVDLFAYLRLNFTNITSEEGHEALLAGVDNINFVEGHSVDDFLALLQLTLGALNKAGLGTNVVIVGRAGK